MLYLDKLDSDYAKDYYDLIHHPDIKPFIPSVHVPASIDIARGILTQHALLEATGNGIYWGIYTHDRLIGTVGLHSWNASANTMEISYEIHPDFKGRGIATAAVSHCLAYTDANLDIHKIIAYTLTDNIASQRVAEKAGFVNKGVLKNNCMYNGKLIDRVILVYPE